MAIFLLTQLEYFLQSNRFEASDLHSLQKHRGGSALERLFLLMFKKRHLTWVLRKVSSASPTLSWEDLSKLKDGSASMEKIVPSCFMSSMSKYPNLKLGARYATALLIISRTSSSVSPFGTCMVWVLLVILCSVFLDYLPGDRFLWVRSL